MFVDATANFGMFYAGGSAAYVQGQNPTDYGATRDRPKSKAELLHLAAVWIGIPA